MDLKFDGDTITRNIKSAPWFPYHSGHLRDDATSGKMIEPHIYRIRFDENIASYIDFLEYGTRAHNIPGAFGKSLPFGIGGRFGGFFHPGSTKHKGFISVKSVNTIINYFVNKYGGYVLWLH